MRQGLVEQRRYREQENSHLAWPDHTRTHYLELKFEAASHLRFIVSRGVGLGGADWAEDISSRATSDSSLIRQISFMEVARAKTYCPFAN